MGKIQKVLCDIAFKLNVTDEFKTSDHVSVKLKITGIAKIDQIHSTTSSMKFETESKTELYNNGSVIQTMQTNGYSKSLALSNSITMGNSFQQSSGESFQRSVQESSQFSTQDSSQKSSQKTYQRSHEVGVSNKISGGVNFGFFQVRSELSLSKKHLWGSSETDTISKTTSVSKTEGTSKSNTSSQTYVESVSKKKGITETKITTETFTIPQQRVVVKPFSKVEVKTQFHSYTDTIHYSVDFHLSSEIQITQISLLSNSFTRMFEVKPIPFLITNDMVEEINKVKYDKDEIKLKCWSSSEDALGIPICKLMDIPIIMTVGGYSLNTVLGDSVPIKVPLND